MGFLEYVLNLDHLLLVLLQETTNSTGPEWLTNTQKGVDSVNKAVTAVAVFVGGVWAYYKFVKGRIFVSNIELAVSGTATIREGVIHLAAAASVKNIGASKLDVYHPLTVLRVLAPKATSDVRTAQEVEWTNLKTLRLFDDQDIFEPGELAGDEHLLLVPKHDEYTALRLEAIVTSNDEKKGLEEKDSWVAVSIVNLAPEENSSIVNNNAVE